MSGVAQQFWLVAGLGLTGRSAVRHLLEQGAQLRAADNRADLALADTWQDGIDLHLGPFSVDLLLGVDAVLASPGLPFDLSLIHI